MKIGAQMFTLRDYCQNLDQLAESLKKVADIGYTDIQISSVCSFEPEWMAEQLKKNGLTCNLTHFDLNRIINDTEAVVNEHNVYGCKLIGVGSGANAAGLPAFAENLKPATKKIHELGSLFMYHNHNWEFQDMLPDGRNVIEALADMFTPDELGFILDTYWVQYSGADIHAVIKQLKGRLPAIHFKDMRVSETGEKKMSWIGGGNVFNFEKLIAEFDDAGTKYAYIEQDQCYDENPFDCLKKSYDYLHSLGLE